MGKVDDVEEGLRLKPSPNLNGLSEGRTEVKYDLTKIAPDNIEDHFLLTFCDVALVTTVVFVNVVAFWRGLFGILSHVKDMHQLGLLLLVGSVIHFHFTLSRRAYDKHLRQKTFLHYVMRKAYTYVFGSSCVIQWASVWYMLDAMSGLELLPPLIYSIVCSVVLVCFRLYKNVLAPPLMFSCDDIDQFFDFQTAFKTSLKKKGTSEVSLYVLDCFFSVFVIGILVVFVWRGVWCLLDIFLIPDNDTYSALGSVVIGYGVVIIVFIVQTPMQRLCDKLTGFWRICAADIYVLFSFIGTINLWRGVWNLLNIYFLPESPALSNWITHVGSFVFLVLIKCSNSLLVRGVHLDGDGGGKCISFPVYYLRHIFQRQRRKKIENNLITYNASSQANVAVDIEKAPKDTLENSKPVIQIPDNSPESKQ